MDKTRKPRVFKISFGEVFKWVIVVEPSIPKVAVVDTEEVLTLILRELGADSYIETGPIPVPTFLELARNDPELSRVKSWEPFGFLH